MLNNKFNTIKNLIIEKYDNLSNNEKKVGKYILDHFQEAALLSSSELARITNVSDTSVIRFTKAIGFKGYIQFKKAMRSAINAEYSPYDSLKNMNPTINGKYSYEYLSSEVHHIDSFIKRLDFDLIDKIADKILSAKTIYLIGIDSDSSVVEFLYEYLTKMGFSVSTLCQTGFLLRKELVKISKEDVVIMSTLPRHLLDEEKAATLTKKKGAFLITFSDSDIIGSLFGSDINISLPGTKLGFLNSNVLSMILCNFVLLRIYEKSPETVEEHIKEYCDIVSDSDWLV